jgi:ATP-dependent helicase Lhr and Lhr-like helicase
VLSISQEDLVIEVQPASAGALPSFDGGSGAVIHGRVREEMREVLRTSEPIRFLDKAAQELLGEARDTYRRLGLEDCWIRQAGSQVQLLLWQGDRIQDTLLLMLHTSGLSGMNEGVCLTLSNTTVAKVSAALHEIVAAGPVDAVKLAATVKNKARQKWDFLLPSELLDEGFAADSLDVDGALEAIKSAGNRGGQ